MPCHVWGYSDVIALTISADAADYNVHTAAGSPASAVDVSLTINPGIVVYQNAGSAALRTGTFAAGSKVTIVNRGYIVGKGGNGGAGGATGTYAGSNGSAGGDAIWCESQVLVIDNSSGFIGGGGGGGGGGEGFRGIDNGGGGGGGGRGRVSSSGGAGGSPNGSAGDGGSFAGGGAGGAGGNLGLGGGDGGDWGSQGEAGGYDGLAPSSGGAPGKAVYRTGGVLHWLGGYDSSRVQGAVD